jgi:hypothetical protein
VFSQELTTWYWQFYHIENFWLLEHFNANMDPISGWWHYVDAGCMASVSEMLQGEGSTQ